MHGEQRKWPQSEEWGQAGPRAPLGAVLLPFLQSRSCREDPGAHESLPGDPHYLPPPALSPPTEHGSRAPQSRWPEPAPTLIHAHQAIRPGAAHTPIRGRSGLHVSGAPRVHWVSRQAARSGGSIVQCAASAPEAPCAVCLQTHCLTFPWPRRPAPRGASAREIPTVSHDPEEAAGCSLQHSQGTLGTGSPGADTPSPSGSSILLRV